MDKVLKDMKEEHDSPQYEDVAIFTCLLYPLIATIGLITLGCSVGAVLILGKLPFFVLLFTCRQQVLYSSS